MVLQFLQSSGLAYTFSFLVMSLNITVRICFFEKYWPSNLCALSAQHSDFKVMYRNFTNYMWITGAPV
jgi:hypothetical protein